MPKIAGESTYVRQVCGEMKPNLPDNFASIEGVEEDDSVCNICSGKRWTQQTRSKEVVWKCIGCGQVKGKQQFALWLAQRKDQRFRPTARCDACTPQGSDGGFTSMKKCSVRRISK